MSTTLNDKIELVKTARDNIKTALYNKTGETQSDDIRTYANKIAGIDTVNNEDKTITENGTYTAGQGYTGLGEVTVNVDSIPEGIFIQENTPTKTTSEAMWLQSENTGIVGNFLDTIPDSVLDTKHPSYNHTVRQFVEAIKSSSYITDVNNAKYHILTLTGHGFSLLYSSTPIYKGPSNNEKWMTNGGDCENLWWARNSYLTHNYYMWYGEVNSPPFPYTLYDVYDSTGTELIIPKYGEEDTSLHIQVGDIKYKVKLNRASQWTEIQDTSNADATSGDILTGKTAFVNNTKVTGTMPNNGAINITPSTSDQSIPAGYTSGGTVAAVDNTIDQNIVAENIKKDVEILGVTGTYEGSGGVELNVFAQTTEPANKNGMWIKGNVEIDNYETDTNVTLDPYWNTTKMSELQSIPYSFYTSKGTVVNNDIYLFGGQGGNTTAYKYNTLTDTYTQLATIPFSFYRGSVASVGSIIYLFGGDGGNTTAYKYDTENDDYEQITDIPYNFTNGASAVYNTDIYLMGGTGNNYNVYKYNTITNSYTKMRNIPYDCGSRTGNRPDAVAVDGKIYLFSGDYEGPSAKTYAIYDILGDSWTNKGMNLPTQIRGTSVVNVNNYIYLMGGANYGTTIYRYNISEDSFSTLSENMPYTSADNYAAFVNNNIFVFGGTSYPTKVQVLTFPLKDYINKTLVIQKGNDYETELIDAGVINGLPYKFSDFYYYTTTGGLNTDLPAYYGNGLEWLGLRNAEVLSVTLDSDSLEMILNETLPLTATVKPVNAVDKSVTWSSDDTTVATVDSSGNVTAEGEGTCTITVTTTDGGFTDTCYITVTNEGTDG